MRNKGINGLENVFSSSLKLLYETFLDEVAANPELNEISAEEIADRLILTLFTSTSKDELIKWLKEARKRKS